MSRNQPTTTGIDWLYHSLMAFNGSGYADMNSSENYLDSYIVYKTIRKKHEAVQLVTVHRDMALNIVSQLLSTTHGAGRKPSPKALQRFNTKREQLRTQGKLL